MPHNTRNNPRCHLNAFVHAMRKHAATRLESGSPTVSSRGRWDVIELLQFTSNASRSRGPEQRRNLLILQHGLSAHTWSVSFGFDLNNCMISLSLSPTTVSMSAHPTLFYPLASSPSPVWCVRTSPPIIPIHNHRPLKHLLMRIELPQRIAATRRILYHCTRFRGTKVFEYAA